MKTLLLTLTFLAILTVQEADARQQPANRETVLANYVTNLKSANTGVIESSMLHLMAFAQRNPDMNFDAAYGAMAMLMRSEDPHLQDRAFLTLSAMLDKRILFALPAFSEEDAGAVYARIAVAIGFRTLAEDRNS